MTSTVARLACLVRRVAAGSAPGRFLPHGEGSATVEFGLVAVPFIALLFAIVETAIIFSQARRWKPPLPMPPVCALSPISRHRCPA